MRLSFFIFNETKSDFENSKSREMRCRLTHVHTAATAVSSSSGHDICKWLTNRRTITWLLDSPARISNAFSLASTGIPELFCADTTRKVSTSCYIYYVSLSRNISIANQPISQPNPTAVSGNWGTEDVSASSEIYVSYDHNSWLERKVCIPRKVHLTHVVYIDR